MNFILQLRRQRGLVSGLLLWPATLKKENRRPQNFWRQEKSSMRGPSEVVETVRQLLPKIANGTENPLSGVKGETKATAERGCSTKSRKSKTRLDQPAKSRT